MTAQQISDTIVSCLTKGYEHRTNREHIGEAIETLLPLLGYIPQLKRTAEYEYAVACSDGVEGAGGAERVRLKIAEGYAANEKANLEEIKSLEKSLLQALSSLQTLYRE